MLALVAKVGLVWAGVVKEANGPATMHGRIDFGSWLYKAGLVEFILEAKTFMWTHLCLALYRRGTSDENYNSCGEFHSPIFFFEIDF